MRSGRATRDGVFCVLAAAVVFLGCSPPLGLGEANFVGCGEAAECKGTPFRVPGVPALSKISVGLRHTCGLTAGGAAWCWGVGSAPGDAGPENAAAPVPGGHQFASIGAGRYHNCGLAVDGTAYCWSSGEVGGLLCGPTECGGIPVAVGPSSYRTLAVGQQHTCALDQAGAAFCWGFNFMGETGSPRFGQTELDPVEVPDGLIFAEIDANHGYTCAVTPAGAPYCWGSGEAGQLGRADRPACATGAGGSVFCSHRPVAVATTLPLTRISAGLTHVCALSDQQRAICWGDNGQGQLGDEVFGTRLTPGATTDRTWSVIEAGGPTTCGTAAGGGTYCWGLNLYGLHGTGTRTEIATAPQEVAGGYTFAALSAGPLHTCGLTTSGVAYCWGDNSAFQLGGR